MCIKNKKGIIMTVVLIFIAALCLCAFRVHLLINFIEPETGFYIHGTQMGTIFKIVTIIACVLVAIVVPLQNKSLKIESLNSESMSVVFFASLCGFLFITTFGFGIYYFANGNIKDVFFMLSMLLCVPSSMNFFWICKKEQRKKSVPQVVLAIFPALFYAVRIISVFMDTTTQINVSQRSLSLAMMCALMLMFVSEAGFTIPEKTQRVYSGARYLTLCLICVLLVLVTSVSYLVVSAFWIYETKFLIVDVLDICAGVYAGVRVFDCLAKGYNK